jgi:poly(beta-D-mannuronate) C5 epimerase
VILDAKLTGWDDTRSAPDLRSGKNGGALFRPFIVSWSGSTTEIAGSHLLALGYQAPKAFGLSFTAGPYNLTKHQEKDVRPTAQLVDNTFENFGSWQ